MIPEEGADYGGFDDRNRACRGKQRVSGAARARSRDAELLRNAEAVKIEETMAVVTHWAGTSERGSTRAELLRRLETERQEAEYAKRELVSARSARLKELYRQLNDRYEKELTAKGLALAKERG